MSAAARPRLRSRSRLARHRRPVSLVLVATRLQLSTRSHDALPATRRRPRRSRASRAPSAAATSRSSSSAATTRARSSARRTRRPQTELARVRVGRARRSTPRRRCRRRARSDGGVALRRAGRARAARARGHRGGHARAPARDARAPARAGRGRRREHARARSAAPRDDPVGGPDRARRAASRATAAGAFVADDGRARLVVVEPRGRAFDSGAAARFTDEAEAALERAASARQPGVRARPHRRPRHRAADRGADARRSPEERRALDGARVARVRAHVPSRRARSLAVLPPLAVGTLWTTALAALVYPRPQRDRDGVRGGRRRRRRRHRRARLRAPARARVARACRPARPRRSRGARRGGRRSARRSRRAARSGASRSRDIEGMRQLGVLCAAGEVLTAIAILARRARARRAGSSAARRRARRARAVGRRADRGRGARALVARARGRRRRCVRGLRRGRRAIDHGVVALDARTLPALATYDAIYATFGGTRGQLVVVSADPDPDARARARRRGRRGGRAARRRAATIDGLRRARARSRRRPRSQRARLAERDALDLPSRTTRSSRACSREEGFALDAFAPALDAFAHPSADTRRRDSRATASRAHRVACTRRHLATDGGETLAVTYVRAREGPATAAEARAAAPRGRSRGRSSPASRISRRRSRETLARDLPRVLAARARRSSSSCSGASLRRRRAVAPRGRSCSSSEIAIVLVLVARLLGVRWHVYDALVLPVLLGITLDEVALPARGARSARLDRGGARRAGAARDGDRAHDRRRLRRARRVPVRRPRRRRQGRRARLDGGRARLARRHPGGVRLAERRRPDRPERGARTLELKARSTNGARAGAGRVVTGDRSRRGSHTRRREVDTLARSRMANELRASIGEHIGGADALARSPAEELDPLPSVLPPEGVVVTRLAAIAARNERADRRRRRARLRGRARSSRRSRGSRARPGRRRSPRTSTPRDASPSDVAFLLGGARPTTTTPRTASDVLVLATPETSPYADVNPDRRARDEPHGDARRTSRPAARGACSSCRRRRSRARSCPRDVAPRAHASRRRRRRARSRRARRAISRDAGYLRVPVVEDPGSFAVRGALLDVWPPGARRARAHRALRRPRRSRSSRSTRRRRRTKTREATPTLQRGLAPARARGDPRRKEHVERAQRPRRAARRHDRLADDEDARPRRRRRDAAARSSAPRASSRRTTTSSRRSAHYLPDDARLRPRRSRRRSRARVRDELGARRRGRRARRRTSRSFLARRRSTATRTRSPRDLAQRTRRRAPPHRRSRAARGEGLARVRGRARRRSTSPPRDHDDLTRAVKAARASKGKTGALAPRRAPHRATGSDSGLRVFLTARAQTQAERLAALLRHQGVALPRARSAASIRRGSTSAARHATTRAGRRRPARARRRSCPAEGFVLVTEEEIFGGRAHRARERRRARRRARPFVEDLRSLAVGDYVVHVEHGIGRYHGPRAHATSAGSPSTCSSSSTPAATSSTCPSTASTRSRSTPAARARRAEDRSPRRRDVREDEVARARRPSGRWPTSSSASTPSARRSPATRIAAADDDYRAFEATFPFDETRRPGARHRRREQRPRDAAADGPPRLRRRRLRQDRGRDPRRLPRRDGGQAGRRALPDDGARAAALPHLRGADARLPDHDRARSRASRRRRSRTRRSRALKDGKVDIVIGTHRLLSKDVHFKDLGLLVVDEEQRFGVTHKERIKQLRTQRRRAHALRDADPAHAADGGQRAARSVAHHDAAGRSPRRAHVRDALRRAGAQARRSARELARGGQVFYVYNRIEGLYEKAQRAPAALARARASPSRTGRWPARRGAGRRDGLEKTMLDFVEGRYDVLVRDRDHRERPRHPARQHDHHRSRRPLRPRAALPAARARRPLARSARTATSSCRRRTR